MERISWLRVALAIALSVLSLTARAEDIPIDARLGNQIVCKKIDDPCPGGRPMAAGLIVAQAGLVSGAASTCGVANLRLAAVWKVVQEQAGAILRREKPRDPLVQQYAKAVEAGALQELKTAPATCASAIATFTALEQRCAYQQLFPCVTLPWPPPGEE